MARNFGGKKPASLISTSTSGGTFRCPVRCASSRTPANGPPRSRSPATVAASSSPSERTYESPTRTASPVRIARLSDQARARMAHVEPTIVIDTIDAIDAALRGVAMRRVVSHDH